MVCRLTIGKKKYKESRPELEAVQARAEELRARLTELVEKDTEAFNAIMAARKMPKDTDNEIAARNAAIDAATRGAASVPLEVMQHANEVIGLAKTCAEKGNVNSVSDAGVAAQMARSAVVGAGLNVKINLAGFEDQAFREELLGRMRELDKASAGLSEEALAVVHRKIDES
jgi:formiminotetrahydrofolate cyclodeaminase